MLKQILTLIINISIVDMITSVLVINNNVMLCWGTVSASSTNVGVNVTLPNTYKIYYIAPCPSLYYGNALTGGSAAWYGFAFRIVNNSTFHTAALAFKRFYLTIGY